LSSAISFIITPGKITIPRIKAQQVYVVRKLYSSLPLKNKEFTKLSAVFPKTLKYIISSPTLFIHITQQIQNILILPIVTYPSSNKELGFIMHAYLALR
jgi:hypothetical protein